MNKYGIENFKIECLEKVEDSSILSEREIYWIHELNSYGITDSKKASTSINKCCKGIVKQAYGYIWKYLPEPK